MRPDQEAVVELMVKDTMKDQRIAELESENERLRVALARAIRALEFADTPESRLVHFNDLTKQLKTALDGEDAQG